MTPSPTLTFFVLVRLKLLSTLSKPVIISEPGIHWTECTIPNACEATGYLLKRTKEHFSQHYLGSKAMEMKAILSELTVTDPLRYAKPLMVRVVTCIFALKPSK